MTSNPTDPFAQKPTSEQSQQQPYGQPGFTQPYGQPGFGAAQPGYGQQPGYGAPVSPSDEKLWATLAHIGPLLLGFIAPLVVYLMYKDRSGFVRDQAAQALNFQIILVIAAFVSGLLTLVFIGFLLLPVIAILGLVFPIMGAVAANRGERYVYPMVPRMVS